MDRRPRAAGSGQRAVGSGPWAHRPCTMRHAPCAMRHGRYWSAAGSGPRAILAGSRQRAMVHELWAMGQIVKQFTFAILRPAHYQTLHSMSNWSQQARKAALPAWHCGCLRAVNAPLGLCASLLHQLLSSTPFRPPIPHHRRRRHRRRHHHHHHHPSAELSRYKTDPLWCSRVWGRWARGSPKWWGIYPREEDEGGGGGCRCWLLY